MGVLNLAPGQETYGAVSTSLMVGFKKFDLIPSLENAKDVLRALNDSGKPRENFWLSGRISIEDYGKEKTKVALDRMLKDFNISYLDAVYISSPEGDYAGALSALSEAVENKLVRAIGLSVYNYTPELLSTILSSVPPNAIQLVMIECNPLHQQRALRAICSQHNIRVEAAHPNGGVAGKQVLFANPVLSEIAHTHFTTPSSVSLRWAVQEGICPISSSKNLMNQAADIVLTKFSLSPAEMEKINTLDS